jgi:hypothetical protein
MKKKYMKPSFRVEELLYTTCLLQASATPPNEIPDYDDWFGARQHKDMWEDDDDWVEEEF